MQRSFFLIRTAGATNAVVVKPFFCIIPTIDRPKCRSLAAGSGGAYGGSKGANVWRAGKRITAVRSTVNNGVESITCRSSNAENSEPLSQLPDWSGITYTRLQLRPEPQLPPRVEHLLVEREGRVVDVVADSINLPTEYVTDLMRFGGIYHSQIPPPPPPNLPPEALQAYLDFIAQHPTSLSSSPSSPSSSPSSPSTPSSSSPSSSSSHQQKVTLAELQKVRRVEVGGVWGRGVGQKEKRQRERSRDKVGKKGSGSGSDLRGKRDGRDGRGEENYQQQRQKQKEAEGEEEEFGVRVKAGSYLRVHVHPKRFPMCYSFDWQRSVIVNEDDYVVIDKPYNVPVGGTVDNLLECCAFFGGQAAGLNRPLQLTHQLDLCTQGCVVMAKNRQFASRFNQLLQDRKVGKLYKALAASAPVFEAP
ncbi:unnamed protein product [Closterium sp. NIES-54]